MLAVGVCLCLAGCQAITVNNDRCLNPPVPEAAMPPIELNKVSLPAYRIEPPDILQIEMLKLVPLPPYKAEVFDVLQIRVIGTLAEQPIDGYYMVEAEGLINLGPGYGSVRVVGMTLDEVKRTVDKKLREVLNSPEVSVQLARVAGAQPVTGQYIVGPDGTINLRQYGVVHLSGMTVVEARLALEKHLAQYLDSPEVSVEVLAYNSKVFYVITQGAGMGDSVRRLPVTGNETVLDAIAQINGLSQLSSKKIWIARPAPNGFGCEQVLTVDWDAITQGAVTATNYQVMPGDRVFIAEDKWLMVANVIGKMTGPFERAMNITSFGTNTIRGIQTLGRQYNKSRSGI
ncbi:MAG: polysaccharide biosynthesis/export family protein [Thermoguttaceae bacterium]|jgi:polysaccharide export outer membrane protein